MIIYLNGQFVPENEAKVSVLDRSFMYGDGLFETVRLYKGRPVLWREHLARMKLGAKTCGFNLNVEWMELGFLAMELAKRNSIAEGVLRVHLSRGVGLRGYSPVGADHPTLVMTVNSLTQKEFHHPPITAMLCERIWLPKGDESTPLKTASKFPHIIARMEADAAKVDECILLNPENRVVEFTSGNIFIRKGNSLITPSHEEGPVMGIMREAIVDIMRMSRFSVIEGEIQIEDLSKADAIYRTSSIGGVTPIIKILGMKIAIPSPTPILRTLVDRLIEMDHKIPWKD